VIDEEKQLLERFRAIAAGKLDGARIRCHGDYHLGQVLYTGKDFAIIDFEGEPVRPLSERRLKRSPLRDVSGMLRSFHYALCSALLGESSGGMVRQDDLVALEPWAAFWQHWVSVVFLKAYLDTARGASFLPTDRDELQVLLDAHLLEKAVYELGYELNNRPDWLRIPLQGIFQVLGTRAPATRSPHGTGRESHPGARQQAGARGAEG
jgi:maltose alpha-D-glucosyltransferase/alpha-amylase